MKKQILVFIIGLFITAGGSSAFSQPVSPSDKKSDAILLTIFLKHDQSKTLREIESELEDTGFWAKFPPEGTEVVSWYVVMGIGQVVTLRVPPEKLRDVNVTLEQYAWGAFRTEFYATYDFRPVWEATYKKNHLTSGRNSPGMGRAEDQTARPGSIQMSGSSGENDIPETERHGDEP